ncbi:MULTISPECIES: hypothetical protein [unclassified Bacillus (in: firmicutes)]|uniref:hypothetical protein n=1 Tax=unclassified Bacillus (in: firmicutes) TaxID=185979 RepID=UPI000BF7AC79|nr:MULTISPECIES: hypothetical protein [unclassified Bacillus (in: firmicutes)]PEU18957.1 hypothetical protein CN525_09115 [Bacillus sp. AFS014408]PFW59448.1 hypothetical protein COL20_24375 [Bacillus sp. AFS075034]
MAGINLTSEQMKLRNLVEERLRKLKRDILSNDLPYEESSRIMEEMGAYAHLLHMLLKSQGNEPVHHRYMINNRGMSPDNIEFYKHIHPTEDLLAFIDNVHANDDFADKTVDHEFNFKVFTRRWGNGDIYKIKRTETGWHIDFLSYVGDCNKAAQPLLFEAFIHDSINYPEALPGYFEWLWQRAKEEGLNHEEVQQALDQLAKWVSICEKNSPSGIFGGYK